MRLIELTPVGATIYLEKDRSGWDKYERMLRHVWIVDDATGDAYMIGEVLVRQGYAPARYYFPDDLYRDRLRDAQSQAQSDGLGLWADCPDPFSMEDKS